MELNKAQVAVDEETLIRDALKAVKEATSLGLILRVIGALAVRIHCEQFADLHRRMQRLGMDVEFSDIDFVAYSSQRKEVHTLFAKRLGFKPDRRFMAYFGESRFIYHHARGWYHVDVFFDSLRFSHDLNFGRKLGKGRLELDYPTATLADLLLEKLQIHEINEKDLKDAIVLLREHEVGDRDQEEVINARYIAKVLSTDWGFWYDVRMNLRGTLKFAEVCQERGLLTEMDLEDLRKKVEGILKYIDVEPKTKEWNKRAKYGTTKRWWREVEELVR